MKRSPQRDSELAQKTIKKHLIASKARVVRELKIINSTESVTPK